MSLGSDDVEIAALLAGAGVPTADLMRVEFNMAGDAQLISPLDLTGLLNASVIIARAPDDIAATAILKSPPRNIAPTSRVPNW